MILTFNPAYHEMDVHYRVAVLPTRVIKSRDKGLMKNAVQQAERWILTALRSRSFFRLHKLNQAIRKRLHWLNNRQRSDSDLSR